MKIYLLKIYNYDSILEDLIDVKIIPCSDIAFAKREMIKHNFDIAIDRGLISENHSGYDGYKMIDFKDISYVFEETEIIEE